MDHHKRSKTHTNPSKHTHKRNATKTSNKPKPTPQQRIHKIIEYETRQMNKMVFQIQLQQ